MKEDQTQEQPAVRTTIVGGRPPGSGKAVGNIPRGIEVLVKKAAVDSQFRQILLDKRAQAADTIGLKLDPTEVAMLTTIPSTQLSAIIAGTRVAPGIRKAFMGYAAAIMLAALGCDAHSADNEQIVTKGITPDTGYLQPQTDNIPKETGILKGIVIDQQGKVIEGANIDVVLQWVYILGTSTAPLPDAPIRGMVYDPGQKEAPSRIIEADATTDGKGNFLFSALPAGVYAVSAISDGFLNWNNAEVQVTGGGTTEMTIEMLQNTKYHVGGGARPGIHEKNIFDDQ